METRVVVDAWKVRNGFCTRCDIGFLHTRVGYAVDAVVV